MRRAFALLLLLLGPPGCLTSTALEALHRPRVTFDGPRRGWVVDDGGAQVLEVVMEEGAEEPAMGPLPVPPYRDLYEGWPWLVRYDLSSCWTELPVASYERALWRPEAAQLGTFIGPEEMAAIHAMMPTWEDVVAPPGAVPVDVSDGAVRWRGERCPLALERGPPAHQQVVAVLLLPLAFAADVVLSPIYLGIYLAVR
ncbi:MAG: hypothetical protein KF878_34260 [Planctomycetes bacterium]|nr:hypothetical protein [Planctomycetota bacterium]